MSIQHVSAVLDCRDTRLAGCCKLVLVILANRTDDRGVCWPSQELCAAECGISVRALSDHLKALEEFGFITRETQHLGRGNGSRTTYTLQIAALKNADAKNAPAEIAPAILVECTGSRPRVTNRQEPTPTEANASVVSARATRLSPDWTLPDDWLAEARRIAFKAKARLSDEDIQNEADKFRDHWHADATPKARKLDWVAAWRTWIRNAIYWGTTRRNAPAGRGAGPVQHNGRGSIAAAALRREHDYQDELELSNGSGREHDMAGGGEWGGHQPRLIG